MTVVNLGGALLFHDAVDRMAGLFCVHRSATQTVKLETTLR